jgi:hypothetical protein
MTTETTPQISPIKQIESLYARLEKARDIYFSGKAHPILGMDEHYAVESSKGDGLYLVNGLCTCMDAQHRTEIHHGWCCHKLAVELYKEHQTPNPESPYPDSGSSLEDQLEDMYPKARPTASPR